MTADRIAAIEAAEDAPESQRVRIARALWDEAQATAYMVTVAIADEDERERVRQQRYLRLADAALAVRLTAVETAVADGPAWPRGQWGIPEGWPHRPGCLVTVTSRALANSENTAGSGCNCGGTR